MGKIWWLGSALFLLPVLALSGNSPPPAPEPAAAPAVSSFNKSEIQGLYLAGDFEALVALLENLRYEHRLHDREDSIFIFKYLGVIYGADEGTRKKAESFLYDLLKLDPNANLTDLGVGMNVENIFEKVRRRYEQNYHDTTFDKQKQIILRQWAADSVRRDSVRRALAAHPESANSAASSLAAAKTSPPGSTAAAPAAAEPERRNHTWMWVAAGGVVAVAVVGVIVAASGGSNNKVDTVLTHL